MINFMAKLEIHGDELFLSPGSVNLSHDYTCMLLTNYVFLLLKASGLCAGKMKKGVFLRRKLLVVRHHKNSFNVTPIPLVVTWH